MLNRRIDTVVPNCLIVESDPLMLTAIAGVLHQHGQHAVMARTEEVAWTAIEESLFDVLVLSINSINEGCGLATRLRSHHSTVDVPVIFLTPNLSADESTSLSKTGGIYSLTKPIDPHELIDLVDHALWLPHVANARVGSRLKMQQQQNDWLRL